MWSLGLRNKRLALIHITTGCHTSGKEYKQVYVRKDIKESLEPIIRNLHNRFKINFEILYIDKIPPAIFR